MEMPIITSARVLSLIAGILLGSVRAPGASPDKEKSSVCGEKVYAEILKRLKKRREDCYFEVTPDSDKHNLVRGRAAVTCHNCPRPDPGHVRCFSMFGMTFLFRVDVSKDCKIVTLRELK